MLGITKEQISGLAEVRYPGKVFLVDSDEKAALAIEYLRQQKQLGFDTETRPSFQKELHYRVSLVQLSVGEECFLFRLPKLDDLTPLAELLEDEGVQKIGLSLRDDFNSLHRVMATLAPKGFVELQSYVKEFGIADNSLQKIYAILFGERISKTQRLTNWEAESLSENQQRYAAIDAWACQKIYNFLLSGSFSAESSPYAIADETAAEILRGNGNAGLCPTLLPDYHPEPHQEKSDLSEPPGPSEQSEFSEPSEKSDPSEPAKPAKTKKKHPHPRRKTKPSEDVNPKPNPNSNSDSNSTPQPSENPA